MDPLAELRIVARPPQIPTAGDGDFAAIERELGTRLPSDWKALVSHYGCGKFGDFLHVFSPFFAFRSMVALAREALAHDREVAASFPDVVPFPLFPDAGGALPWAATDNGDNVYWVTRGEPDAWTVAIRAARAGGHELFEVGAVTFIARWLRGEIRSKCFGFHARPLRFDPWARR